MARPGKVKSRMKGRKTPSKSHAGAAPRRSTGLLRQDGRPDTCHKFTMQQEALNTEGRSIWRTGLQLRHKAVSFVSAGDMKMDEESKTDEHKGEKAPERPPQQATLPQPPTDDQLDRRDTGENPLSVDMLRDGIASADISDPAPDQVSIDDESSEDEIVFLGRHRRMDQRESPHFDTHTPSTRSSSTQSEIDRKHAAPYTTTPKTSQDILPSINNRSNTTYSKSKDSSTEETEFISLKKPPKHRGNYRHYQEDQDDDGFLADYIANMDDDYLDFGNLLSSDQEIDACANPPRSAEKTGSKTERMKADASSIGMLAAEAINETEGTAHTTEQITEQIKREQGFHEKYPCASENHATETLTGDESAFALEEGASDEEYDSQTIESIIRELEESTSRPQRTHNRSKGRMFASATAFANSLESDPYYGFDVMDFGRPSLRKKKKGKHSTLDLVLSDSDLEMELEKAWRNDREKKSNRKRQREYLRSNGLLGRGLDDPDLKSKYPSTSMSFDDLNDEICKFLLSSRNSLPLPPMAKQRRKVVHDLAHDLCLNSQSRGKGSNRFTILHKTSRTVKYTQKTIDQADRVFSKGKFKYGGAKMWDQHVKKSPKVRSGRPDGNVSYMDGDVVGASAPEIGAGNKGRAMLEKMGWSTGTALGAANNKGILQPVTQVVKNSKAGLG